ncbi:hypothetical protein LEP1GSC168_2679 [Leptospira santarosai str. HAI134]|nr:hypothetical protein [Leptospira santarosai]EMO22012.1 hypothetical protein LEP1GSC168_2679 [Leptospira santarosai str. HAI134]
MSISFHRKILEDGTLENMMRLIFTEQDAGVPTFLNSKDPF